MKKVLVITIAILAMASLAMAQNTWKDAAWSTTVPGGVTAPPKGLTIDKLGAHQNGGRGCVGCHAPHSGARGNGGSTATMKWDATANAGAGGFVAVGTYAVGAEGSGDEVLWGQDLTPLYNMAITTAGGYAFTINTSSPERVVTGIAMCLSCHDGNVAKGAMMQNASFEQAAGMLPAGYGTLDIPTLLGNDGSAAGNYQNDHPVGPAAKLGLLPINAASTYFAAPTTLGGKIGKGTGFTNSAMSKFYENYGSPTIIDARAGAGFATDVTTSLDDAYVVCTTCHTPHSMYTTTATLNGVKQGTVPTFFFIAAPYNPGANVADGTKASSATQFCRQCHFTGAGGSNEGSGISIPTAF